MDEQVLDAIEVAYRAISTAEARARAECDALVARAIAEKRVRQGDVAERLGLARQTIGEMQKRARHQYY